MEQQLSFEHRLTAVEDRSKSNTKRLEDVELRQDNLDKLVSSVAVMATKQDHIEGDVKEIKANVKTLTEKPAKRWDTLVEKVIWAVASAVIAFLLARIGL